MTDNELSITTDQIMGMVRLYKKDHITEKELYQYIEICVQMAIVKAEKAQMQEDYEDTQKIIEGEK